MNSQDLKNLLEKTDDKLTIFADAEIFDKYVLSETQFLNLISVFLSDNEKLKLFNFSHFKALNTSTKLKVVKLISNRNIKLQILSTLSNESLCDFFKNNKSFYIESNIHPYEIVMKLDVNQQRYFVDILDSLDLTLTEKKEILAILKEDTKQIIDIKNLPKEYQSAIGMTTVKYLGQIILDFEKDLEEYRGLDNLIKVSPEQLSEDEKYKFMQLCDICPNLQVVSVLNNSLKSFSTVDEYKEAEQWISSILDNFNNNYSKAQKLAIIDNAIGKKISYSPNFNTEVFNSSDCRALWKTITTGYGVCNGIAKVEQYILNKVGIESEIISSGKHAFLKLKNIELPMANGKIKKGNTILDPTWNLTRHRFSAKPDNFCISYEMARKNDIDSNGKDHFCHRNDDELQDATLNLDEQSLRNLFESVGLADKNGQFPIKDLIEESKLLHKLYANQPCENINRQFELLYKTCPEFATCQNSSMSILNDVLLNNEFFNFNRCVVNRVYNKTDKAKIPILFVYIDLDELGKKFYFADKSIGQFVELEYEEFIKQFECYENDMKKRNGLRLWESDKKDELDLSKSSGNIVAKEELEK